MKYLLFIAYNSDLMHNAVYENINILYESINQLVEEENLKFSSEKIPTKKKLINHLAKEDDYFFQFTNQTWFHIQELSERNYICDKN